VVELRRNHLKRPLLACRPPSHKRHNKDPGSKTIELPTLLIEAKISSKLARSMTVGLWADGGSYLDVGVAEQTDWILGTGGGYMQRNYVAILGSQDVGHVLAIQ